ncbi:MAG: protein phosphatase 2C domain-containing protein [Pseudomonadota bacterium]
MPPNPSDIGLESFARTVTGRVRVHNEDSLLSCPSLGLWAIADGMGGHHRGEVASALAIQILHDRLQQRGDLVQAIHAANQAILDSAHQDPDSRGMGTTLVAVQFDAAHYRVAWIGDSRAYLLNAAGIHPLTKDHSWVQAMVDAGRLSESQALSHPKRNVINQCLGQSTTPLDVGVAQGTLQPGERLLLCSDGLNRELSDARMLQISLDCRHLEQLVSTLIDAANAMGGHDNISCAVIGRKPSRGLTGYARRWLSRLFRGRPAHPLTRRNESL